MKLKIDENLPREVATLFRDARHDAMTVWTKASADSSTPRTTQIW